MTPQEFCDYVKPRLNVGPYTGICAEGDYVILTAGSYAIPRLYPGDAALTLIGAAVAECRSCEAVRIEDHTTFCFDGYSKLVTGMDTFALMRAVLDAHARARGSASHPTPHAKPEATK